MIHWSQEMNCRDAGLNLRVPLRLGSQENLGVPVAQDPTINCPCWATGETFHQPTRPAEDIKIIMKGQHELTQPIEWDDGEA